jgi:hypothetical protein
MGKLSNEYSTSSAWDRAFLLSVFAIFSVGTLFGLGRLFPLTERNPNQPNPLTDLEQAPDADGDGDGGGDD